MRRGGQSRDYDEYTLMVAQALMKEGRQMRRTRRRRRFAGWSTKTLEEVSSRKEVEDTEEKVQWRCIDQEETHDL